jgi:N-acetylglucosamine-6-phosphate deacetylase
MAFALTGARIFDGEHFTGEQTVIVDGARIKALIPGGSVPDGIERYDLGGGILAPGFIDIQVNGGGGALLNASPDAECVRTIAVSHRAHGVTGLLPTVITDTPVVIRAAIAAVRDAREHGVPGVMGIHIEGPFIDDSRKGAHDARFIRMLTDADVAELAAARCGKVMMTLSPRQADAAQIARLVDAGIAVSLGHSDATYDEAMAALKAGATAFTHLYNAMSQMTGREPGMAGAAISDRDSFFSVIADGHHVHDAAMQVAFAVKRRGRAMLISDAMPPAAGGPDVFRLQGREVRRADGKLTLDDGTLAGSALTMDQAVRNCVTKLRIDVARALRMASLAPAMFLKLDGELGRIAPGFRANLVHLDDNLTVKQTWIEGT